MNLMYERIPSVDALVNTPLLAQWSRRLPRPVVVSAARAVLGALRDAVARGALNGHSFELEDLARDVAARLEIEQHPPLSSRGVSPQRTRPPGVRCATPGCVIKPLRGRSPVPVFTPKGLHSGAGGRASAPPVSGRKPNET